MEGGGEVFESTEHLRSFRGKQCFWDISSQSNNVGCRMGHLNRDTQPGSLQGRELNNTTLVLYASCKHCLTLSLPFLSLSMSPPSLRTREDGPPELRHRPGRGHRCIWEAGQPLEARPQTGGGDGHGRHPQRPHSDFPRVEGGQRLLQTLEPGGLKWDEVACQGGHCGRHWL